MKVEDVAMLLLSSATEDWIGLHEAIWELNGRFPHESLGRKYDLATEALKDLSRRRWIRFERVRTSESARPACAINDAEIAGVLSNPVSWYPDYDGMAIVFTATDLGTEHYMQSATPQTATGSKLQ